MYRKKALLGLEIRNGTLLDCQTLWTRPFSVAVRSHVFLTSTRETYDTYLPEKWGGDLFLQLYGRSALIAPINGTVVQRSCDQQYWENFQHVLYVPV